MSYRHAKRYGAYVEMPIIKRMAREEIERLLKEFRERGGVIRMVKAQWQGFERVKYDGKTYLREAK